MILQRTMPPLLETPIDAFDRCAVTAQGVFEKKIIKKCGYAERQTPFDHPRLGTVVRSFHVMSAGGTSSPV